MSLTLTAPPAVEPVSLAEAKAHLRVDGTADDTYIASLVQTSRLQIEQALGLALIEQSWIWTLQAWPTSGALELPLRPVTAIDDIAVRITGGASVSVASGAVALDADAARSRLVLDTLALPQPDGRPQGIAIAFTAGFGTTAADVPAPIRHALLLLVAHWYEHRGDDSASPTTAIPPTVSELLGGFRPVRL